MVRKYCAFISYRHRPLDIAVAKKIHRSIERFVIPRDLRKNGRKRLGLVFRDREELPLSSNLSDDIFTALDNSEFLIVVCTPDTPQSLWCRREIQHFIEVHGRSRVITVLAAGTPEESIPKEITHRFAEDGVTVLEQYEPLCAYLVDKNQKRTLRNLDKELLRLYAAMLNCPYDSLRQRNKRRKMQQALAIATLAFAVAVGFIAMLLNRNQKIQAQNEEIAAQNLEIAAQKRDVQLRESELLVADAREALDIGDTQRAIENAVAALPKSGEDRPYYAPAESVLMEAMDIFSGSESTTLMKDTVLEQMTPIEFFDISPDGSRVVTVDGYSVLHCFDAESGEKLWNAVLSNDDKLTDNRYARIADDGKTVLCRHGKVLECRDMETGARLWQVDTVSNAEGYFIYDAAGGRIALVQAYSTSVDNRLVYRLELAVVSAEDGQILHTVFLEELEDSPYSYRINNSGEDRLPAGGCFSADGRYFACALSTQDKETSQYEWCCFAVDLETGEVLTDYRQETGNAYWSASAMEFRGDDLLVAAEPDSDLQAGGLWKLDWRNNALVWNTLLPEEMEEQLLFNTSQTSWCLFWDTVAFLGRFERLYSISLETGEVLHSVQLPGSLSSLYTVGETTFGFSLYEGSYAIGWHNSNNGFMLTTNSFFYSVIQTEKHSRFETYGGGVIQYYSDGQSVEITVSNNVRPGYLALISSEAANQLILKRPVQVERNLEINGVDFPVEARTISCSDAQVVFLDENTVVVGQLYSRDADYNATYFFAVMDRNTRTVEKIYEVERGSFDEYYFLPDGSGYIWENYSEVTSVFRNGTLETLTEKLDPAFPTMAPRSGSVRTESCYLSDGNVLTAWFGMRSMQLLKNGEAVLTMKLPEALHCTSESGYGVTRTVKTGRNGLVLSWLADYDAPAEEIYIFDLETGAWLQEPLKAVLYNENALAFSEAGALLALVDEENMVRIFDARTERETAAFPLQLPQSCVLHMDFMLQDQFLIVKTKDADVLIYDLTSGQIVYQDKLTTSSLGELRTQWDEENQRLYILDTYVNSEKNALCVDVNSWTTLGYGGYILFFDPQSGELYHSERYAQEAPFVTGIRIPSTEELVQFGQELLAESEN